MLGTPLWSTITSSSFTLGASHQSSAESLVTISTVDPSIPQLLGAQPGIGSGSNVFSTASLPPATPFPGAFSMWSTPQIGSILSHQPNSIQNQTGNVSFTPGSVGPFHPGSGGFPPIPSGNINQNPTPGSSVGLPFEWNWNTNNSLGSQNLGLTYSGSNS